MSRDGREEETHSSFGLIGIHRQTGTSGRMFGSNLDHHHEQMAICLHAASRDNHLGQDWYHAGDTLFEVVLTPAQFAEMLTSHNVGSGVPCTIQYIQGEGRIAPLPPDAYQTEAQKAQGALVSGFEEAAKEFDELAAPFEEILEKKGTLKKADKEALLWGIEKIRRWTRGSSSKFYREQFKRAVEKTVVEAKAQVDAFVLHTLTSLGMEALKERFPAPQITSGEEDE